MIGEVNSLMQIVSRGEQIIRPITASLSGLREVPAWRQTWTLDRLLPPAATVSYAGHNYGLFNVLRAIISNNTNLDALNTRQVVYFEAKNAKSSTFPKDGFVPAQVTPTSPSGQTLQSGDLVDPWGNLYFTAVDSNYNNVLVNPYKDDSAVSDNATVTDGTMLRTGVVCYSYGTDGIKASKNVTPATPYSNLGDDVVSWQ